MLGVLRGLAQPLSPPPCAADPPRTPSLTLLQEPQGGGLAVVHCSVDSRPPATLALYRDGNLVATSGSQVAPSQRLAITASRNALRLEIRGVRPQDGGQYRCTATNTLGNASATQPFVTHSESCCALLAPIPGAGGTDMGVLGCFCGAVASPWEQHPGTERVPAPSHHSPCFGDVGWRGSSNERGGGESPQKHTQGHLP